MSSVLSSLFSRDPKAAFAYHLSTDCFYSADGIAVGKTFKKADPTERGTCFWASLDVGAGSILKIQAQKLKTLRHPNVLTYLDSLEVDGNFYLITEECLPLKIYINEGSLSGQQKEFVVSWGLFQLMNCLKFLHQEAKISHDNVRHSIFVTGSGDWKLTGFDKSLLFSNPRSDLNSLAFLIWEIFNGFNQSLSKPGNVGKIPQQMHDLYNKLVKPQAARLNIEDLLRDCRRSGGFLKNQFVDTLLFLDEFQLKDAHEKQTFFAKLNDEINLFPEDIAKNRILPKLIHSYEYGDAGSNVLAPLFKLSRLLDESEYQRLIIPCLCKLFCSPDRSTRVKLLDKIDEFAPRISAAVVNEKIYGNVSAGFADTNPAVRENTVKAMVAIADKLNNHNLNNDLMRHLARLQGSDDQPGIRTNATICLGKISCYIDPCQRQRILISAFTRALKDPFPPARMAAILTLSATQQYYSLVEVANRILPSLSPVTCDPEKQVRDQCFKALHGFIEKLEKASENPDLIPELEAQVRAGGKNGILTSDKVPQWASWALKSLSGKFYKAKPPVQSSESKTDDNPSLNRESTRQVAFDDEPVPKIETESEKASSCVDRDDLKEESVLENENKLMEESSKDWTINENGWDNDQWEGIDFNEKVTIGAEKEHEEKVSHGSLKLKSKTKKAPVEVDLDCLLGMEPDPMKPISLSEQVISVFNEKKVMDGWECSDFNTLSSGYTSFASDSAGNPSADAVVGWDDISWGDSSKIDTVKQRSDGDRAKLATRNEIRRQELVKKRAAKAGLKK